MVSTHISRSRAAVAAALALVLLAGCGGGGGAGGGAEPRGEDPSGVTPAGGEGQGGVGTEADGGAGGEGSQVAPEAEGGDTPVYIGVQEGVASAFIAFASERVEPRLLETANDAPVVDVRWQGWGAPTARGSGAVRVNTCRPTCAEGAITRRGGVRVELSDLREGECAGEPARFYTRARASFPRGVGLPDRKIVVLFPRCVEQG